MSGFPGGADSKEFACNVGEDPLEKGTATHSSTLARRIPWTEEPGGLHSMGSQRVGHGWATSTFTFLYCQSFYPFGVKTLYFSVVILEEFWKRAELPVLFSWCLSSLSIGTFSIQSGTPEPLAFQSCITCDPSLCCSLLQALPKSREPMKMHLAGSAFPEELIAFSSYHHKKKYTFIFWLTTSFSVMLLDCWVCCAVLSHSVIYSSSKSHGM